MHNGMDFSTYDDDNDKKNRGNCAVVFKGAWWYKSCHTSNLNGLYSTVPVTGAKYMSWIEWKQDHVALKGALMMIKPKS